MPEPALPEYLSRPYAAKPSQRGGTLIAEGVISFVEHWARMADVDGYRPARCLRCHGFLEGHGCRGRKLRDEPESAEELIRRFRCALCGAVWQVLPAFIARNLHRTWGAVQSRLVAAGVLEPTGAEWRVGAKPTTTRRWTLRMLATAVVLTQALAECGGEVVEVVKRTGSWCSRCELVEALAGCELVGRRCKLGQLACWVHRLVPGVRVM
jgi:hypothetical protein